MRKAILAMLAVAVVAVPAIAEELTLDEVLKRHYEAIGGLDNWKALRSARLTGKMVMAGGQMEAPFTVMVKRPDKARMEFTLQGMTAVQATDGETYWMVMPFMGKTDPEIMADDQAKQFERQADLEGVLVDWKEKGHEVELLGPEEVEGTPAYVLGVVLDGGDERRIFLDAEYFVPIRIEGKTEVQGNEIEVETTIGDYKEVGGLMFAHSMESRPKGAPAGDRVITIESIELDPELSDDLFVMPNPKAEVEPENKG